ncbi:hypothetical protein WCLP8_690001 [uncultured Gammaproteobacteria bacterium]
MVALAYPDRIAQRRPGGEAQYRLSNGRGAVIRDGSDALARDSWLAVAEVDGDARLAKIFLAAALTAAEIEAEFSDQIEVVTVIAWDEREQAVLARRQRRLGELVLADEALKDPDPARVTAVLLEGLGSLGLSVLPWTADLQAWRARVEFVHGVEGEAAGWPDLSDGALLEGLADWLGPLVPGMTRASHFKRLDLTAALQGMLSWDQRRRLDELAPTHLSVPSGSKVPIDYSAGEVPVLAVRVQEMFGATVHPAVAGGRIPLLLHLLSPAHRPVQITRDLPGFWTNSYPAVRADLRGRYPKHPWPDDPLSAPPTNRTKRRAG